MRRAGIGPRLGLVAVLVLACGGEVPGAIGGWVFPSPAPLPAGARAVPIDVAPLPAGVQPGVSFACPMALLQPTTLVVDRATDPWTVGYRLASGEPTRLRWSWGASAREVDGLVEIVGPDGTVVMREGEVADGLGGASADAGTFDVCLFTSLPRQVMPG